MNQIYTKRHKKVSIPVGLIEDISFNVFMNATVFNMLGVDHIVAVQGMQTFNFLKKWNVNYMREMLCEAILDNL